MSNDQRATAAAATETRMRAVVQDTYGGPEVLRLAEVDRPTVGDGEVLVRVVAAGLDRGAWHLMTGAPYPLRLAGYGVRAPKNPVRGRELAGVVAAVGSGGTRFAVGDEVFGIGEGTFAEYAPAREDKLAPKPAALSFEQAAAVPISATTALQAVRDHGQVSAGQKVLVIGASGGVGSFAVQIAKAFGAEVTGVCSPGKVDLVRSLGADHVLDYTRDELPNDSRYDVVLDAGGHRPLRMLRRALAPKGTLVLIGSETGGRWLGGLDRLLRAMALDPLVGQKIGGFLASEKAEDLTVLSELLDAGQVTPAVDRTYPLTDAAAAMQHLIDGRTRGKIVLSVS